MIPQRIPCGYPLPASADNWTHGLQPADIQGGPKNGYPVLFLG